MCSTLTLGTWPYSCVAFCDCVISVVKKTVKALIGSFRARRMRSINILSGVRANDLKSTAFTSAQLDASLSLSGGHCPAILKISLRDRVAPPRSAFTRTASNQHACLPGHRPGLLGPLPVPSRLSKCGTKYPIGP